MFGGNVYKTRYYIRSLSAADSFVWSQSPDLATAVRIRGHDHQEAS